MLRFSIAILFLLGCGQKTGGESVLTYGGKGFDVGYCICPAHDGGYMIVGETSSSGAGDADVWLVKLTPDLKISWAKTIGGEDDDVGYGIAPTRDSGYIIVGYTRSFGVAYEDVYLIKVDENGDTVWTRTYGGDQDERGFSIALADKGYLIAGQTGSKGGAGYDAYLIRTDLDGKKIWEKTFGGKTNDFFYSAVTAEGGYIAAGKTWSFARGWNDVYLIKINDRGDTLWTKTYGGRANEGAKKIMRIKDGYLIVGFRAEYIAGTKDVWLLKINDRGDTVWTRTYGGDKDEEGLCAVSLDDGYLITGYTKSFGAGKEDLYLIRTNSQGDTVWTKTYGGENNDRGYTIQVMSDGEYLVVGGTFSTGRGGCDLYLIKKGDR